MAFTAPRTWVSGETVTAALMNTHVRDNFNMTAPAVVTTKGDLVAATAANTITRLAIGSDGAMLVADSAATPGVRWSNTNKTASSGVAYALDLVFTLTAAANSDSLTGMRITGVYARSTFTGLTAYGIQISGGGMTATGTGTINNAYGLFITAPTIATTNWSFYVASGASVLQNTFIGDTANANATLGLTINQGAADDEILALKSSDVAHGMTNFSETDTFISIRKRGATAGGVLMYALAGAGVGFNLQAFQSTTDTLKSTAATATIMLGGGLKNGTTSQSLGANANILTIDDDGTVHFIFDADGESYENVGTAWINFDEHDDIALLNLLAAKVTHKDDPIRRNLGKWLKENRGILEELKLVTFNRDGNHFINRSRTQNLLIGAMRQVGAKLDAQAERLLLLEKKVLQLAV